MTKSLNLIGEEFGRLTVVKRAENDKHGKTRWVCSCDCGNSTVTYGTDLKRGKSKSCGCIQKIHGLSSHKLYNVFTAMKNRCYNPESISYPWYGAQGIDIYKDWLDDYTNFHDWALNTGFNEDLEIDRIDSSKGYYPENCRWVTRREQNINQRARKDNTSGVRGVKWNGARRKWEVNISVNKKQLYIGLFEDFDEAVEARKSAELKYW